MEKAHLYLTLCGVFAFCAISYAETNVNSDAQQQANLSQEPTKESYVAPEEVDLYDPADWFEVGADFRFRTVGSKNIRTLDSTHEDSRLDFQRYRTRLWANFFLNEDIDLNTMLTWEFRTWQNGGPASTDFDEVLFDQFNLTMRNLFDMPLTAVVGRQDIILGRGWLVLEGTPLDGSRTIFFDAARLTYDWQDTDTTVDLIYTYQEGETERWLPVFNDRDRHLAPRDEQGVIAYLTNTSLTDTQLEGYFIYKYDEAIRDPRGGFPPDWSYDAEIYTFGGAVDGKLTDNWFHRNELAVQTGKKDGADVEAWGTKHDISYHFNNEHNHQLRATYEFLSGDDPDSDKNKQFDPLWGKWPQWSELYIYTYAPETMIAETSNLSRLGFGHSWQPHEKWTLDTDYHLLWAHRNSLAGEGMFADSGKFRGQLVTFWAKYQLTEQLNGHFLAEYFNPNNYYARENRDSAYFLRFNIEYTF